MRFYTENSELKCLYCDKPVQTLAKDRSFNLAQLCAASQYHELCGTGR